MTSPVLEITPIGRVGGTATQPSISIEPMYRAGLTALEGFSHINVLFWCHHLDTPQHRRLLTAEQPYVDGPATVGVFATRSPARPNPVALTPVPVLNIDQANGIINVAFIDAEPGSPVIDLKPYHPAVDRIREVSTPEWCAGWPDWYEDSATFDWGSVFNFAA